MVCSFLNIGLELFSNHVLSIAMKDLEVILLSVLVKGDNWKCLKNTSLEHFFHLNYLAFGKDQV